MAFGHHKIRRVTELIRNNGLLKWNPAHEVSHVFFLSFPNSCNFCFFHKYSAVHICQ